MKSISTPECAPPAGHYSQGIVHNGLIYVSGMLAVDPATGERRLGTIEEQTEQALRNIEGVLKAAGSGRDRVIKCTCYISDIELWGRVNAVYATFFGTHKPARAVVPTRELHYGFLVEIDCIAAVEG
ncbi:RidA family protein [Pseudodesulfovibrio sediminis]|uniref:Enamine deaminase RidA n=1 Tax=Pseudodesulfovibrio sediminis TaxID=2810563 RepID=A0ABM7P4U9_9BACT|nr:Rid family detoxifying hydrolase [Pseudodesulfovibrio sediminis]BCS87918.1 enamine deaminase RidA [Pseudodesulfovibrio sediminis]